MKLGTIRQYTSIDSDVVYARRHAAIEEHLAKTPPKCHMRWVVLSPNCFMSNHLADVFGSLPASSTISYPLDADAGARLVDPRDVGELAAAMLTRPENYGALHGRKLDVSGPAEVTMGELAELYSEALGRPIRFERVSVETWVAAASQHIPAWLAEDVVKNFELWKAGELCFARRRRYSPCPRGRCGSGRQGVGAPEPPTRINNQPHPRSSCPRAPSCRGSGCRSPSRTCTSAP